MAQKNVIWWSSVVFAWWESEDISVCDKFKLFLCVLLHIKMLEMYVAEILTSPTADEITASMSAVDMFRFRTWMLFHANCLAFCSENPCTPAYACRRMIQFLVALLIFCHVVSEISIDAETFHRHSHSKFLLKDDKQIQSVLKTADQSQLTTTCKFSNTNNFPDPIYR